MNGDDSGQEMPKYKCYKEVWALKIKSIDQGAWNTEKAEYNYVILPADEGFASFTVDQDYIDRHKPEVGGYYVVYVDGYKSFSPAEAFETGYTRL